MNARSIAGVVLIAAFVRGPMMAAELRAQEAPPPSDNYEELYQRYLDAARTAPEERGSPASIDWVSDLVGDRRANGLNDIVTVRVVESIVAVGRADSSLTKESDAHASISNLFGLETKFPSWIDPTNLINTASDTSFEGGGQTTRSGELSATMTARVIEVLPNGDLVLEGVKEIDINGDRQVVVLTGIVRAQDIGRDNVVLSPQVAQLRIRYFGRGLIRDNLQPGWLIRVFNKIF